MAFHIANKMLKACADSADADIEHRKFTETTGLRRAPPQTKTRLFVSTATAFRDRPVAASEKDENTIITDYWLSYMSVRRLDESRLWAPPKPDLESKVEDFCRRLNTLSRERRTLTGELSRMWRDAWREFARRGRTKASDWEGYS